MKFPVAHIVWSLLGETFLIVGICEATALEGTSRNFSTLLIVWLCATLFVSLCTNKDHKQELILAKLFCTPSPLNVLRLAAVFFLAFLFISVHIDDPYRLLYVGCILALTWKNNLWRNFELISIVLVIISLSFSFGVLRHGWWYCHIEGLSCSEISATYVLICAALTLNGVVLWRTVNKNAWDGFVVRAALFISCSFLALLIFEDLRRITAFDPFAIDSSVELLGITVIASARAWILLRRASTGEHSHIVQSGNRALVGIGSGLIVLLLGGALLMLQRLPLIGDDVKAALIEMPDEFVALVLTAEDPTFFYHSGVDLVRTRDAIAELILEGEYRRGGSTISMQLAKLYFLSYEKTLGRKLFQMLLAVEMEILLSKREILARYLESVPLSAEVTGWREGVARWYGVPPQQLSTDQLVRLVLAIYNPTREYREPAKLSNDDFLRGEVIKVRMKKFGARLSELWRNEKGLISNDIRTTSLK